MSVIRRLGFIEVEKDDAVQCDRCENLIHIPFPAHTRQAGRRFFGYLEEHGWGWETSVENEYQIAFYCPRHND